MSLLIAENDLNERLEAANVVFKRMGKGSDDTPRPRNPEFKSGIPNFVREIMAAEHLSGANQTEVAENWNVSNTAVRYASEGRVGAHQLKGEREDIVESATIGAELMSQTTLELTAQKLLLAVAGINADKLMNEAPLKQTIIARNLALVHEKMKPQEKMAANVTFVVHVPTQRRLEDFGNPVRVIEGEARVVNG